MKGNVVITGVSTGIGYHCTKKFIEEGYKVFGSIRRQVDVERLSAEFGDSFEPLIFDVTDKDAITKEVNRVRPIIDEEGIRCLINNSGIATHGVVELMDVDEFRRQFEVNFFGLIEVTKAFMPMLGTKADVTFPPGKIINMSSIASRNSLPFLTPYSSSKAAVDRFSEGLRRELMMFGIDVIVLNPGPVETPIWEKVEEPGEEVMQTSYGKPLKQFLKFFHKESKRAIKVEDFAAKVFKVFRSQSPKTSEVIMKDKFLKYYLPKATLSVRGYEKLLKKILKLEL